MPMTSIPKEFISFSSDPPPPPTSTEEMNILYFLLNQRSLSFWGTQKIPVVICEGQRCAIQQVTAKIDPDPATGLPKFSRDSSGRLFTKIHWSVFAWDEVNKQKYEIKHTQNFYTQISAPDDYETAQKAKGWSAWQITAYITALKMPLVADSEYIWKNRDTIKRLADDNLRLERQGGSDLKIKQFIVHTTGKGGPKSYTIHLLKTKIDTVSGQIYAVDGPKIKTKNLISLSSSVRELSKEVIIESVLKSKEEATHLKLEKSYPMSDPDVEIPQLLSELKGTGKTEKYSHYLHERFHKDLSMFDQFGQFFSSRPSERIFWKGDADFIFTRRPWYYGIVSSLSVFGKGQQSFTFTLGELSFQEELEALKKEATRSRKGEHTFKNYILLLENNFASLIELQKSLEKKYKQMEALSKGSGDSLFLEIEKNKVIIQKITERLSRDYDKGLIPFTDEQINNIKRLAHSEERLTVHRDAIVSKSDSERGVLAEKIVTIPKRVARPNGPPITRKRAKGIAEVARIKEPLIRKSPTKITAQVKPIIEIELSSLKNERTELEQYVYELKRVDRNKIKVDEDDQSRFIKNYKKALSSRSDLQIVSAFAEHLQFFSALQNDDKNELAALTWETTNPLLKVSEDKYTKDHGRLVEAYLTIAKKLGSPNNAEFSDAFTKMLSDPKKVEFLTEILRSGDGENFCTLFKQAPLENKEVFLTNLLKLSIPAESGGQNIAKKFNELILEFPEDKKREYRLKLVDHILAFSNIAKDKNKESQKVKWLKFILDPLFQIQPKDYTTDNKTEFLNFFKKAMNTEDPEVISLCLEDRNRNKIFELFKETKEKEEIASYVQNAVINLMKNPKFNEFEIGELIGNGLGILTKLGIYALKLGRNKFKLGKNKNIIKDKVLKQAFFEMTQHPNKKELMLGILSVGEGSDFLRFYKMLPTKDRLDFVDHVLKMQSELLVHNKNENISKKFDYLIQGFDSSVQTQQKDQLIDALLQFIESSYAKKGKRIDALAGFSGLHHIVAEATSITKEKLSRILLVCGNCESINLKEGKVYLDHFEKIFFKKGLDRNFRKELGMKFLRSIEKKAIESKPGNEKSRFEDLHNILKTKFGKYLLSTDKLDDILLMLADHPQVECSTSVNLNLIDNILTQQKVFPEKTAIKIAEKLLQKSPLSIRLLSFIERSNWWDKVKNKDEARLDDDLRSKKEELEKKLENHEVLAALMTLEHLGQDSSLTSIKRDRATELLRTVVSFPSRKVIEIVEKSTWYREFATEEITDILAKNKASGLPQKELPDIIQVYQYYESRQRSKIIPLSILFQVMNDLSRQIFNVGFFNKHVFNKTEDQLREVLKDKSSTINTKRIPQEFLNQIVSTALMSYKRISEEFKKDQEVNLQSLIEKEKSSFLQIYPLQMQGMQASRLVDKKRVDISEIYKRDIQRLVADISNELDISNVLFMGTSEEEDALRDNMYQKIDIIVRDKGHNLLDKILKQIKMDIHFKFNDARKEKTKQIQRIEEEFITEINASKLEDEKQKLITSKEERIKEVTAELLVKLKQIKEQLKTLEISEKNLNKWVEEEIHKSNYIEHLAAMALSASLLQIDSMMDGEAERQQALQEDLKKYR